MKISPFVSAAIISCFAIISLSAVSGADAGQRQNTSLTGQTFSSPDKVFPKSQEWIKQPIKYGDRAIGADIAISLDQHLYAAMLSHIRNFAKEKGIDIAVQEGSCGISASLLNKKQVDIAGFCCPPSETDRLPGLKFHTLAIGALGIFVHPDNPIDNITFEQAQKIFQGKIRRWSDLKTEDGRPGVHATIRSVGRLHCKARPGHWRLLLDNEDLFSSRMQDVGSIPDVLQQVSARPTAIGGFETIFMAETKYPRQRKLKPLKINGFSPTNPDHLLAGDYPLYFTFNITTWEDQGLSNPVVPELVDFLLKKVAGLDKKYYMVPAAELRKAGWKFVGNELIGEPEKNNNQLKRKK